MNRDRPLWQVELQVEIDVHAKIGTWEGVELPEGKKPIGCWWVYAVKTTPEGEFEKANAGIVAQGFTQHPGMDYYEATSPVVKFGSLCVLMSIANALNWEIHMMDVKGAYLNSDLDEEIYMCQPEGFDDTSGQVLKLKCTLYSLKQSRCTWHKCLCNTILELCYTQSCADKCLYIRRGGLQIEGCQPAIHLIIFSNLEVSVILSLYSIPIVLSKVLKEKQQI